MDSMQAIQKYSIDKKSVTLAEKNRHDMAFGHAINLIKEFNEFSFLQNDISTTS